MSNSKMWNQQTEQICLVPYSTILALGGGLHSIWLRLCMQSL